MLCSTPALHFPAKDLNHHGGRWGDVKIIFAGHCLVVCLVQGCLKVLCCLGELGGEPERLLFPLPLGNANTPQPGMLGKQPYAMG